MIAVTARNKNYQNLLMSVPDGYGTSAYDLDKIERICREEFLMTYEILQNSTAETDFSQYPVTRIGTNFCYHRIMSLSMTEGGFFTQAAWKGKERHAVLNETAAFRMFGSNQIIGNTFHMDGRTWIVTGVIQDGNKKDARIYVPSSITEGQPKAFMALLNENNGVTIETIKSGLIQLGIFDTNSQIFNLHKAALLFRQLFIATLYTAAFLPLLLIIRLCANRLLQYYQSLKRQAKKVYLRELFSSLRIESLKASGLIFAFGSSIMMILFLLQRLLEMILVWKDLYPEMKKLTPLHFPDKTVWFTRYLVPGAALFIGFLAVLLVITLIFLSPPKKQEEANEI